MIPTGILLYGNKLAFNNDNFISEYFLVQGLFYNDLLDYRRAIECLNKSILHNNKNINAYMARAYAFFESQNIEMALADYESACKLNVNPPLLQNPRIKLLDFNIENPNFEKEFKSFEFSKGLALGFVLGFNEGVKEFTPSAVLKTITGIGQGFWHVFTEPYTLSREFTLKTINIIETFIESLTPEQMNQLIPEIKIALQSWHHLGSFDQGRILGKIIGKYGVDIFACGGAIKIVKAYRDLKYANASITFEACIRSNENRKLISAEVSKRIVDRKSLYNDGKIIIHWGRQNKHVRGSHNFDMERGVVRLSSEELVDLLSEKAGMGQPVVETLPFLPGYKERVNLKK